MAGGATLRPGQTARVLFRGPDADDLNRAPIMIRPIVRVGLPWGFTAVAAIPPPLEMFDVRPRLSAIRLYDVNEWLAPWSVHVVMTVTPSMRVGGWSLPSV